jgi:hypothetical protein
MELNLTDRISPSDELLTAAANQASDGHLLCADVSERIFPRSLNVPSEEMLSAVSLKLRALVSGIENRLLNTQESFVVTQSQSWRLLARSGFLREAPLIDFVLARHAEDRLSARIAASADCDIAEQLPVRLLASSDTVLASIAQTLLAANSMQKHPARRLYCEMSAELLHQTCWRIVAALQVTMGQKDETIIANARKLLAHYDESQTVNAAARKAVHFLEGKNKSDCADPDKAGLPLFAALIASQTGLEQDHILRLIDEPNSAPLAVMLRVLNLTRDEAMAAICLFNGFELTPREISMFDAHYTNLDINSARDAIAAWSLSRARFLAFPSLSAAQT